MARRSWLRDGDAELEQLLRRVDRMITTAAREQTLDSIRRFAATLLRQGFLVTEDFMRQLAQLAQAKDKRLDARTFADEFYTTRHYRLVGPAYALRLVRVRDIPILYRLGGVNGAPIILMGILPTGAAV